MHRLSGTFLETKNPPQSFPSRPPIQMNHIYMCSMMVFMVFRVGKNPQKSSASNNTPSWMSGRFHQGTGTRPPRQRVETSPWARRSPRDAGREPTSLQPSWCFQNPLWLVGMPNNICQHMWPCWERTISTQFMLLCLKDLQTARRFNFSTSWSGDP